MVKYDLQGTSWGRWRGRPWIILGTNICRLGGDYNVTGSVAINAIKKKEKDFKGSNTVNRGIFRDKMQNVLHRVNKVALWFLFNVILGDT